SPSKAARIFQQYGKNAISIVKKNPYILSMDVDGIGFLSADRIARKLGIPEDSVFRLESGVIHVLHEAAEEGHIYLPMEILLTRAEEILSCTREIIIPAINNLKSEEKIFLEENGTSEESMVYLTFFYIAESESAAKLKKIIRAPLPFPGVNINKVFEWTEKTLSFHLADKQKAAIEFSLTNKVMILTGGPGTGKTTTIDAIVRIHRAMHRTVLLAAPTGRAAKRLSEVTNHEARTIHRLLEFNHIKGGFLRNEENQLEGDLIIIDESSMIDVLLFYHLMKALPLKSSLIFVGDIYQLPSVGAGNILRDLIQSGTIPVIELTQIFRQAQKSKIISYAHMINRGEIPSFRIDEEENLLDFYFIKENEPVKVLEKIITLVTDRIPHRFGFHPIKDIQILSPMNKGVTGVQNLNASLQSVLNPSGKDIRKGNKIFRVNDKVMQIRNNYTKEVYNGDIGFIIHVDDSNAQLVISLDQREILYSYEDLDELVLAYAISVHKSQGCEFNAVILPLLTQHFMLLQRNLLYTGITRGKKLVILIGTPRAVAMAVKNDRIQTRYSRLSYRLQKTKNPAPDLF
ncbi:MAG: recombinase RecD, partial [Candidatus Schekmanbacteria bacterium RBG_13_48_7]